MTWSGSTFRNRTSGRWEDIQSERWRSFNCSKHLEAADAEEQQNEPQGQTDRQTGRTCLHLFQSLWSSSSWILWSLSPVPQLSCICLEKVSGWNAGRAADEPIRSKQLLSCGLIGRSLSCSDLLLLLLFQMLLQLQLKMNPASWRRWWRSRGEFDPWPYQDKLPGCHPFSSMSVQFSCCFSLRLQMFSVQLGMFWINQENSESVGKWSDPLLLDRIWFAPQEKTWFWVSEADQTENILRDSDLNWRLNWDRNIGLSVWILQD